MEQIEWNEHIQRRAEMYIGQLGDGSDPKDGIYTLLKGVLALGVGERLSAEVKNGCAAVRYYGRGIPLENVV